MNGPRTVIVGGVLAAATSVTIVCVLAVSSALALTDVAGESVSSAPVVVPSEQSASSTPTIVVPTAATQAAQTIPAPEPRDVRVPTKRVPAAQPPARSAPTVTPKGEHAVSGERTARQVIAQFEKDGDWSAVTAWVATQKWDSHRAEAWLQRVHDRYEKRFGHDDTNGLGDRITDSQTPAQAGKASGTFRYGSWAGLKRGQSPDSPSWRD